ncbi:MAG: B12-binding domain-containing radical SAM protein [Methylovirgula sp.]
MTGSLHDSSRHILCVFPRYTSSFATFEYSYELTMGTKACMPPQGLLVIAATLPQHWQVRFIDENMEPAEDSDFAWADAVFVSGMHIQRRQIDDICRRAHKHDKPVALGGPSVSACPDYYPNADYLHIGELGDATEALIEILARDIRRPDRQIVLKTEARRDLTDFPVPAYELAKIDSYLIGTIQFSSGCPYRCEFCDIPGLYGRVARIKTAAQIIAELDKLLACGVVGQIYFVDDNFIANRAAVAELLPHLIAWQKRTGYAVSFACEATLNIARNPEILAQMREAAFDVVFCGIETPEPEALKGMDKKHNLTMPILDSVRMINAHGMQVVSGIILGLDTDTLETGSRIIEFIEQSKIPMLTINLLQALPCTPLWDRLAKDNRLDHDESRESNVQFLLPYDDVVAMWRNCMDEAYDPVRLFGRYEQMMQATWPNRLPRPLSKTRCSPTNVRRGLTMLAKVLWKVGVRGDYRRPFWRFALPRLLRGEVEAILTVAVSAHHLIMFARDCRLGRGNASNYSPKLRIAEEAVTQ